MVAEVAHIGGIAVLGGLRLRRRDVRVSGQLLPLLRLVGGGGDFGAWRTVVWVVVFHGGVVSGNVDFSLVSRL